VYFRTSNDVPSANNLQGHIQEGTTHAAVVMKDKGGKFYHLDSPQGYGGPYKFSGPFYVLKLRKNKLYGEKKPEDKSLVTASANNTAKLWDVQSGRLKTTLQGHSNAVESSQFSPDGKSIVTASDDNTAKIWVAGSSVSERATDFMSRLYATGPENTDAALAALAAPNNQTEWKNLITAMKNHAGLSKEAVHTLVNNQVSSVQMQEALKTIVDTFY
jgi:WD40 repeat protein